LEILLLNLSSLLTLPNLQHLKSLFKNRPAVLLSSDNRPSMEFIADLNHRALIISPLNCLSPEKNINLSIHIAVVHGTNRKKGWHSLKSEQVKSIDKLCLVLADCPEKEILSLPCRSKFVAYSNNIPLELLKILKANPLPVGSSPHTLMLFLAAYLGCNPIIILPGLFSRDQDCGPETLKWFNQLVSQKEYKSLPEKLLALKGDRLYFLQVKYRESSQILSHLKPFKKDMFKTLATRAKKFKSSLEKPRARTIENFLQKTLSEAEQLQTHFKQAATLLKQLQKQVEKSGSLDEEVLRETSKLEPIKNEIIKSISKSPIWSNYFLYELMEMDRTGDKIALISDHERIEKLVHYAIHFYKQLNFKSEKLVSSLEKTLLNLLKNQ